MITGLINISMVAIFDLFHILLVYYIRVMDNVLSLMVPLKTAYFKHFEHIQAIEKFEKINFSANHYEYV